VENQNRVAKVLLLLAGFALVLCLGMAIGGAIVYGVMRIGDIRSDVRVKTFDFRFDDLLQEPSNEVVAPGAVIVEVVPGSPAEDAGLQEGEVIVAVDGQSLGVREDLADLLAQYEPGDRVTLQVQQPGEKSRKVGVKLGEHPEKSGVAYLGVKYSSSLRSQVPLPEALPFALPRGGAGQGVIIAEVAEDSPAAEAGLQQGDVITAIDGEPVASPRALTEAVANRKPGDRVTLGVYRPGGQGELEIEVRLGQDPEEDGKAYLGVWIGSYFRYHITPGSEGGGFPPGLESRGDAFFFSLPDALPLDQLPFDLDALPFGWKEFEWLPSEDDSV
jgi:membrane-associated protease RseP (regulator of RpoE activity)